MSDSIRDLGVPQIHAWNRIDDVVASELGAMLGVQLDTARMTTVPAMDHTATIAVTLADPSVEAQIGIGIGQGSVPEFLELLFGEPEEVELALDAICELANAAGGATQRASLANGVTFALGLPEPGGPPPDQNARAWMLQHDGMRLYVWTRGKGGEAAAIPASELASGMVLASEVRGPGGLVVLRQGSVVTERTVERLMQTVGPEATVSVVQAA